MDSDSYSWYDPTDAEIAWGDIERHWSNGKHITQKGEWLSISSMTSDHLKNTIRYFKSLDTSPLQRELRLRQEAYEDQALDINGIM